MSYSNIGEAVMAWTEGNGVKVKYTTYFKESKVKSLKVKYTTAGAVQQNRTSDCSLDL